MATIKLRRGLRANLPASGSPGEAFFCYDTGELFIVNNSGAMVEINSFESNYSEKIYNAAKSASYNADSLYKYTDRVIDKAINTSLIEIYGGGIISFSSSYELKWTLRIIVMGAGRGSHFSTNGFFQISMPSIGTWITRYNAAAVQVTSGGIPLAVWDTLYYKLPIGSSSTFSASNFIIYPYNGNGADYELPYNAIPIALHNSDNHYCYLFNRIRIAPGGSTSY